MLRFALFALLLANGGYLAWSHGWMASLGWKPQAPSEEFRLQQQIRPDAVVVRAVALPSVVPETERRLETDSAQQSIVSTTEPQTLQSVPSISGSIPESSEPAGSVAPALVPVASQSVASIVAPETSDELGICLQTGGFTEEQIKLVRAAVLAQNMPNGSWEIVPETLPGRWMVYIKAQSDAELATLRNDLRSRKISVERAGGTLEPGLSLGRFASEETATRELTKLLRQNVRGARVVQEHPASTVYVLKLPKVTNSLRPRVQALQPHLKEKPLRNCTDQERQRQPD